MGGMRFIPRSLVTGLLLSVATGTLHAQYHFLDSIPERFLQNREQRVKEQLFVQTDRDVYVTGDIIWFHIVAMDGHSKGPLDLSKVAYVELISKDQRAVQRGKIALYHASGSGSFFLPASLTTGTYILRAYSRWMRDGDPASWFEKPLTIINTLRQPDWTSLPDSNRLRVVLRPEGGHLVAGLQNNVAFAINNQWDDGIAASGAVVNSNGDTVVQCTTKVLGMGSFQFVPGAGEQYTAVFSANGYPTVRCPLPKVLTEGCAMQVTRGPGTGATVRVSCPAGLAGREVGLVVHAGNLLAGMHKGTMSGGGLVFSIPGSELEEGVTSLTLLDNRGQLLCERQVFRRPVNPASLTIRADRASYGTREPVQVTINADSSFRSAQLTISVFRTDTLQPAPRDNIFSRLLLRSGQPGSTDDPGYFFTEEGTEAADLLMLTRGRSGTGWEELLASPQVSEGRLPEYDGHLVTATLEHGQTGGPAADTPVYLSVPGGQFQFSMSVSDNKGDALFDVPLFYGNRQLVIQTDPMVDSTTRIALEDPFSAKATVSEFPELWLPAVAAEALQQRSLSAQVPQLYRPDRQWQFLLPMQADTLPFYGEPDKTYLLDDYTRFTTMEEVTREYVSGVSVRRNNNDYFFRVRNTPFAEDFTVDPLILLDGVPVFDINRLMQVDPLKIRQLDVVARRFYFGRFPQAGILSFKTYDGDRAGFPLGKNALLLDYVGLQLPRSFYSPEYATEQERSNPLPDFRNLLYWSPELQLDEEGGTSILFYTSDLPGHYVVSVGGINAKGVAVHQKIFFDVR